MLVRRPVPAPGESQRGYLLRIVEENELDGFGNLIELIGKYSGFYLDSLTFDDLRPLTGVTAQEWNNLTLQYQGKTAKSCAYYHGQLLHTSARQKHFYRYCPLCIAEKPFVRSEWHINQAPVCIEHGVILLDWCQSCGKDQTWERTSVAYCNVCKSSLINASAKHAAPHVKVMQSLLLYMMREEEVPQDVIAENPAFEWLVTIDSERVLRHLYLAFMDAVFGAMTRWSFVVSPSVHTSYEMLSFWFYGLLSSPRFLTRTIGELYRPLEQDAVESIRGRRHIIEVEDIFDERDGRTEMVLMSNELSRYEYHFDAALKARLA